MNLFIEDKKNNKITDTFISKDYDENRYLKINFNISQREHDFKDLFDFESFNIIKSEIYLSDSTNLVLNKSQEIMKMNSLIDLKESKSKTMICRVDLKGKFILFL